MPQQSVVLADGAGQLEQETTSHIPSKYFYPEFAGPGGERYLKKLLRQVLPMALYRTWEIFADHQAKGNDCYLSIPQLAVLAGRSLRTMQKNLAVLQARQLLVEHAERKVFRGPQGEPISRMVVIKDFANLYALAHEYHEWLHTDAYIAPAHAFVEAIAHEPLLVEKLRRFDNYRRILYTRVPGPGPRNQEEDRWFTEYCPGRALSEAHTLAGTTEQQPPCVIAAKLPPKNLAKEVAKDSPKRRSEASQEDIPQGDSFDSAASFSVSSFAKGKAGISASPAQRVSGSQMRQDIVSSPPPDHPLARSFVDEIAVPFGDRNKKGSITRILKIIANAYLEEAEVLLCLVRSYVTARETSELRPEHYDQRTGQANRMPLFCALFERFIQARVLGQKWNYTWQQMEEDIATDEHLALWRSEQQVQFNKLAGDDNKQPNNEHGSYDAAFSEDGSASKQEAVKTSVRRPGRTRLSRTEQEREERAAHAQKIRWRLLNAGIPIQEPAVLWEHVLCGCPLYHKRNGKEVCALCSPDPDWPEEVMALLHSIVEAKAGAEVESEPEAINAAYRFTREPACSLYSRVRKKRRGQEEGEQAYESASGRARNERLKFNENLSRTPLVY